MHHMYVIFYATTNPPTLTSHYQAKSSFYDYDQKYTVLIFLSPHTSKFQEPKVIFLSPKTDLREWKQFSSDADSDQRCPRCCGCDEQIHMDCRSPVEKRDSMATLWVRERPNPCLDRLLLLPGSITSKKVLIHYAQVCFRWLLLTDNKEKDVANAREKVVELVTLCPWEV